MIAHGQRYPMPCLEWSSDVVEWEQGLISRRPVKAYFRPQITAPGQFSVQWAVAPKGIKSCRTQGYFRSSVCPFIRSFVCLLLPSQAWNLSSQASNLSYLRPEKADFRPERADFRPERADFRFSFQFTTMQMRAQVSLTTYFPWATC